MKQRDYQIKNPLGAGNPMSLQLNGLNTHLSRQDPLKRGPADSIVPKGIRTPVAAVKGQCPRPLDDGDKDVYLRFVELGGIEPPTSCMPCKRSPS